MEMLAPLQPKRGNQSDHGRIVGTQYGRWVEHLPATLIHHFFESLPQRTIRRHPASQHHVAVTGLLQCPPDFDCERIDDGLFE